MASEDAELKIAEEDQELVDYDEAEEDDAAKDGAEDSGVKKCVRAAAAAAALRPPPLPAAGRDLDVVDVAFPGFSVHFPSRNRIIRSG